AQTTVTDEITKLVWERSSSSTTMSWSAASLHCEVLFLGGSGNWRLPSAPELESLTDVRAEVPFQDQGPFGTTPARYWSSTEDPADTAKAFAVGTGTGSTSDVRM